MDGTDSENEGQLLIDESVDTSKKKRGRKPGVKNSKSNAQIKNPSKVVAQSAKTKSVKRGRPKQKDRIESKEPSTPAIVRTSNRVRKRVRRHSPSPVRTKKEPPRKKLKVKIKHVKKHQKMPLKQKKEVMDQKSTKKDSIDIESISDEELADIQYSSIIVDENRAGKQKKKERSKGSIKLKLSLGKVLSPQIPEAPKHDESVVNSTASDENSIEHSPEENEKPVVQPLILTKRQTDSTIAGESYNISSQPTPETSNSENETSFASPSKHSPYYSSSSEDHKPLTLKLSVGRPKVVKQRSVAEVEQTTGKVENVFPNIRRSWSVAYPTQGDTTPTESPSVDEKETKSQDLKEKPALTPSPYLSTTPYFSAGLQSLLDVVSVEIKEQNKTSGTMTTGDKNALQKPQQQQQDPLKQPLPLESHFLIRPSSNLPKAAASEKLLNHQGHLPSLTFPKPKLNFSSKKRQRAKSIAKASPERPSMLLASIFEVKNQHDDNHSLEKICVEPITEKEKRRRDKKKTLNSDFVDPDTLMSGPELEEKNDPVWKKATPSSSPKPRLGGFSLLTPQMVSKQPTVSESTMLKMSSTCKLPSKNSNFLSKKSKKGLSTTKQRLANKLKMGKAFVY